MAPPPVPISYRRRPVRRVYSGIESGSRRSVPVSPGRPPSLHGLLLSVRNAGPGILLLRFARSRIFRRGRHLPYRRSAASQVLRGRVTSPDRTSTACALELPVAARAAEAAGQSVDLPTSAPGASIRARFFDRAGFPCASREVSAPGMLPSASPDCVGIPEWVFRGSIARPHLPSTSNASAASSRRQPHDGGRRGSLLLQRLRLSLYTLGRL